MRTDGQHKTNATTCVSDDPNGISTESQDTMKVVRKSLHPLQIAAGDKENLVGAGRMAAKKNADGKPVQLLSSKKHDSSPKTDKKRSSKVKEENTGIADKATGKKASKVQEDINVIIEDMTSEAGPSDHYWKRLAETRRVALDNALQEKEQLIERLCELTEENNQYKQLLADAQDIINTLNEMADEMESESEQRDIRGEEETVRQP